MNVNYIRMNPSGNITLLVTDRVPRNAQSEIANRLMQMDPSAEQVGFLEESVLPGARIRLQMMGGEFCGNATMSAAAYLAAGDGLADGESAVYSLEVSGAQGIIDCSIVRRGEIFMGSVPMPIPRELVQAEILPGVQVPLVRFDGIAHVIVPEGLLSSNQAEALISGLCDAWQADALGIICLEDGFSAIRPLVYVRSTDSAVWENSCGSGTAALGAWQAYVQKQNVQMKIGQPNPDTQIGVFARYESGMITEIEISGRVCMENSCIAQL